MFRLRNLPAADRGPAHAARAGAAPSRRGEQPHRGRRLPRIHALAVAGVAGAVALAGCSSGEPAADDNNNAAVVNGVAITIERLEREARSFEARQAGSGQQVDAAAASRQALQSLIQREVLFAGAKDEGIEVSDADIDRQIRQYEQQASQGGQDLDNILSQQGMTRDDLREQARVEATAQRVGEKLVPGKSDAEVDAEVKARRGDFLQVQARHVLLADESTAKRVRAELERTGDWATAAKQSQDPGSKDKGGDLGFLSKGQTVPEFDRTLYQLAEQGNCKGAEGACQSPISQPVKSQFGWHVIQVTGVRMPETDEIRAQIEGPDIGQRRQAALQDWFQELLSNAKVTVNPRFGTWDAAKGEIVDRDTAPQPAPTPAPGQQAPQSTQADQ